jgi:hypothetical protein
MVLMLLSCAAGRQRGMFHRQDGTPNTPEVNVWLSTIGRMEEANDFCLGRNTLRRTLLWQSGGPGASKARGIALCTAKNFVRPVSPSQVKSGQISDMSSGGATLSGSGLT